MAEKPDVDPVADLVAQIARVTRVLLEHSATIVAIVNYLKEQPACDVARLSVLLTEQRARLQLPPHPSDLDASLQALLRDFEGPPQ